MATAVLPPANKQFYRRQLPESCVDFAKMLFSRSLMQGNSNIYFRLASQFRTQEEPAYCAVSTLVMCLNALEVDPGRVWKGPWRWYHESMLDCCIPLDQIRQTGMTLAQFVCLAVCNRLNVRATIAGTGEDDEEGYQHFKSDVLSSVKSDDTILVISYDRKVLQQTGSGHFSPLSAFDEVEEMALILDVARFKYPPHWVKLRTIWLAMKSLDPITKSNRGYAILRIAPGSCRNVLFGIPQSLCNNDESRWALVHTWSQKLIEIDQKLIHPPDQLLSTAATEFAEILGSLTENEQNQPGSLNSEATNMPKKCCQNQQRYVEGPPGPDVLFNEKCGQIMGDLRKCTVFALLKTKMPALTEFQQLNLTTLSISWILAHKREAPCFKLFVKIQTEFDDFSEATKNELEQMARQWQILIIGRSQSESKDQVQMMNAKCCDYENRKCCC